MPPPGLSRRDSVPDSGAEAPGLWPTSCPFESRTFQTLLSVLHWTSVLIFMKNFIDFVIENTWFFKRNILSKIGGKNPRNDECSYLSSAPLELQCRSDFAISEPKIRLEGNHEKGQDRWTFLFGVMTRSVDSNFPILVIIPFNERRQSQGFSSCFEI